MSDAAVSLLLSVVVSACSLDNRHLELDSGGSPGAPSAGAGGEAQGFGGNAATAGYPAGRGGEAGAAPQVIPIIDGCADLDANRVADCTETLIDNPNFESDVSHWLADTDTTVDWDAQNAASDLPSGSALVASRGVIDEGGVGVALRAAAQCVAIDGAKLVLLYANAFVDADQDSQGRAEVDVAFFDSQDCSGTLSTSFSTPQPLDPMIASWFTLKAGSVSGATTKSALVKLAVLKPFRASSFQARFDNVLLKAEDVQP